MPFDLGNSIAALNVKIGADLTEFRKTAKKMERAIEPIQRRVTSAGSNLTKFVTLPVLGLGAASLKSAARMEQLENGLKAILGDAEEARREFERLEKVAELPGLGLEQAVQGSLQLQAVGFSAEFARDALQQFGNALAVSGGTPDDLQEVIRQLSQIQSLGKITAENFNVIRERVPLVGEAMQRAFGTTSIEAIREAGVSADEFVRGLIEGLREVPRAEGGLANAFENIQQVAVKALDAIGTAIDETLDIQGLVTDVTGAINRLVTAFNNLSPSTRKFIIVATGLAAVAGPLLLALGGIVSALPIMAAGFAALTGPIGLTVAAIAAVGAAVFSLSRQYESFGDFSKRIWGDIALSQIKSIDSMLAAYSNWLEFLGPVSAATRRVITEARKGLKNLTKSLEAGGARPLKLFDIFGDAEQTAKETAKGLDKTLSNITDSLDVPAPEIDPPDINPARVDKLRDRIKSILAPGDIGKHFRQRFGEIFGTSLLNAPAESAKEFTQNLQVTSEQLRTVTMDAQMLQAQGQLSMEGVSTATLQANATLASMGQRARELGFVLHEALVDIGAGAVADLITGFRKVEDVISGVKHALRGLVADLIQATIKAAALSAIGSVFGISTGGFGSLLLSGLGFGGARALGGPVVPGKAFLVGERGPELFVPRQSGTIVPNGGITQVEIIPRATVISSGDIVISYEQGKANQSRGF